MNELVTMDALFRLYGGLLSDRQRYAFESYYMYDLSLSEIAEELTITKQGVSDLIKRAENELMRVESVVGLRERNRVLDEEIRMLKDLVLNGAEKKDLLQAIENIESEQNSNV